MTNAIAQREICIGQKTSGPPFKLPVDALVQTFAFIGIRGSGKTSGATKMAEEFTKAGLPWIALDPTGVWWGLRAGKDGKPDGGLKGLVVIGGPHGDLPLDRADGEKLAEAIVSANVCAVIDLKYESKTMYRTFVADFCERLLRIESPEARHIFIEEAPEMVPQRPKGRAMQVAHAAVDKLIRLGRNSGYGASLISQRAATIDKDVLSQAENVFAFRSTHNLDRKAFKDWLEGKMFDGKDLAKFTSELASLSNGVAWFWSPEWLSKFERILFSRRETFHPGETRTVGVAPKAVSLIDAAEFVEKVKKELSKKQIMKLEPAIRRKHADESSAQGSFALSCPVPTALEKEVVELKARITRLEGDLAAERGRNSSITAEKQDLQRKLGAVRAAMQPQYEALQAAFSELGAPANGNGSSANRSTYESWLSKAPKSGIKKMLEVLIEKGEATRTQFQTLSGVAPSTGYEYIGWLKRNNLVENDGQKIRLLPV